MGVGKRKQRDSVLSSTFINTLLATGEGLPLCPEIFVCCHNDPAEPYIGSLWEDPDSNPAPEVCCVHWLKKLLLEKCFNTVFIYGVV